MRRTLTALVMAGLTVTAACSAGGSAASSGEDARTPAAETSTGASTGAAPAHDGPRIPDGSWSTVHTIADARRQGLSPKDVREVFGEDGRFRVTLKIAGSTWVELGDDDEDGVMVPGDGGALSYDDQGRAVLVSRSQGCPGCVGVLVWSLKGDVLSLRLAEADSPDIAGNPVDRLVNEGDFRRAR
jgi:hypothetical protein